jgi:hypothetical protein
MLALVVDTCGVEVQPVLVNISKCGDERVRLSCVALDMMVGTENPDLQLMQQAGDLVQRAHSEMNPLRRTGAALKGALKTLREYGARYRRPKDVSDAISAIEKLIGKDGLDEENNIFLEMLGLPLRPRPAPSRRKHRKKKDDFPRFSADHIFPGGLIAPSSHAYAVPNDGTTFSAVLSSPSEDSDSNASTPVIGPAAADAILLLNLATLTTQVAVVQAAAGEIPDDLLDSFLAELI